MFIKTPQNLYAASEVSNMQKSLLPLSLIALSLLSSAAHSQTWQKMQSGIPNPTCFIGMATANIPAHCTIGNPVWSSFGSQTVVGSWYLPAQEELQVLFYNLASIGGIVSAYWSSTQHPSYSDEAAYIFGGSSWGAGTKSSSRHVRCVRGF
jgi:hypothetical protein